MGAAAPALVGIKSVAVITSSTSWITHKKTGGAAVWLQPVSIHQTYLACAIVAALKSLHATTTHTSTVSRADFKPLSWSCRKISVCCYISSYSIHYMLLLCKWGRIIVVFIMIGVCSVFEHDFRPVVWWWQAVCSSSRGETAGCGGLEERERESVCLVDTWVARPVAGTVGVPPKGPCNVGPAVSAARVPAGLRFWTSD